MDHLLLSLLNLTSNDVQDVRSLPSKGSVSYYVTFSNHRNRSWIQPSFFTVHLPAI